MIEENFTNVAACSQTDAPIFYTVFSNLRATDKVERSVQWGELVATIKAPAIFSDKAACPLLSLARYGDKRSATGCLRNAENVTAVHGIECDYDGEVMPIQEAADTLNVWGIRAVLYTSASHTPLNPRWRILLPLSRPQPPELRAVFVARLNALLGGVFDDSSFTLSQSFYFGHVRGAEYVALEASGDCIDTHTHAHLDTNARYPTARASAGAGVATDQYLDLYDNQPPATPEQLSDLRGALDHLAACGHGGNYDDWQRVGQALKGESKHGNAAQLREMWLDYSRACGGYKDEHGVFTKWEQLGGDRTGRGAIFNQAAALGWINPASGHAPENFESQLAHAAPNALRYKLLSGADLRNRPTPAWRVRGVLPTVGVAAVFGPSGSGKSFLAMDMAAAIAEGSPWFGCRVGAAPVVYCMLEGEGGASARTGAWETYNRRPLPDKLHLILQPFTLTTPQDVTDLAAVIPNGAVVYLDTLNRAAPTADENSSKDMGQILEAAKALQARTGGLVIVIHHSGKNVASGMRGHSSLFAAMDAVIEVSRNGDDRAWSVAKSKDGQDGGVHHFRTEIIVTGRDSDDEEITSCVVIPACKPLNPTKPRTPTQSLAMETFEELNKAGKGVHRRAWSESFCKHSTAISSDAKRKAFNRAVLDLVGQGFVTENDDVYVIPELPLF